MDINTKNEVVLTKMEREEKAENYAASTWTKKESKQVIFYFVIAFVVLFIFGYLVNHFLL